MKEPKRKRSLPDNIVNMTVRERIDRELTIIDNIFRCQLGQIVSDDNSLIGEAKYLRFLFSIQSDTELFKIESYISHYSERIEKASNNTLLENELRGYHKRACDLIDLFNSNLTEESEIVKAYRGNMPEGFEEKLDYQNQHSAVILVNHLRISKIIFGAFNCFEKDGFSWNRREFNYVITNFKLAEFCDKLSRFIADCGLQQTKVEDSNNRISSVPSVVSNFEDLFTDKNNVDLSLKVLLDVNPSIVDVNFNFILGERQKGSIVAWVRAMKKKGLIFNNVNDSDMARVLNSKIHGLNLGVDGRTLRNYGTTSYDNYYLELLSLLP